MEHLFRLLTSEGDFATPMVGRSYLILKHGLPYRAHWVSVLAYNILLILATGRSSLIIALAYFKTQCMLFTECHISRGGLDFIPQYIRLLETLP
eukprot:scaffold501237_cov18-Prasinocladus_malaysianus.AAC.1